jgi:hypothetical protein
MEEAGMEVPVLQNRPDALLSPELHLMLRHFGDLSRQRPPAFSTVPCAIPLDQIESFHRIYKVSDYMELEDFSNWMIELDNTLVDFYIEKQRAEEDRERLKNRG